MDTFRLKVVVAALAILTAEVTAYSVKYHGDLVQPGPAVEYTYPVQPPVGACPHNLLVSCDEHYESVPCTGGHEHAPEETYDGPVYHQPPPPPFPPAGYSGLGGPQYGEEEEYYDEEEYGPNADKYRMGGGRNKWMKKYFKLKSKRGKHRHHRRREGSELEDLSMEEEEM